MPTELARLFDQAAVSYDAERRLLVPGFDAFYSAAIEAIGDLPACARVLDIGSGTGLFSALVSAHWPETQFTLTDLAPGMLARAEERFLSMGLEPPEIRVMDTASGLPRGPFDAIISALSIHHLADDAKQAAYRQAAAELVPGGRFVNAEQICGATPVETAGFEARWSREVRELGATEEMIAAAEERMTHDRCAPLDDQLAWMRDAGLTEVRATWQRGRFAVLTGRAAVPRRSA
ncbi:MAG: class I SAM-dependent methyltransferase [Pseudomonadota bacterium]